MGAPQRTSRTQKERRDETRRVVLDATVECLMDVGFAKTTTLEVQRRAGVSRGALLHHFPAKSELLVAAVRHLAKMRGRELNELAARLPEDGARVDAAIDLLWESFSGPLFYVAMELRAAARTDPEFRAVLVEVERELRNRIIEQARQLFGTAVASRPNFEDALDLTLQLMMGVAMSAMLHGKERQIVELVDRWKSLFPTLLEPRAGT